MIPFVYFPLALQESLLGRGYLIPEPKLFESLSDLQAMKLALQEAYRGLGAVSPNPLVGCVILDSKGRFLGKGHHAKYGGPHAEVNAVEGVSAKDLQDARVFVTLEPCAHEGKTPSCAKMLAKLPVKEVIFGLVDPNPLVAGQGAGILRAAGKQCLTFSEHAKKVLKLPVTEVENLDGSLRAVCEHFLWNFEHKKVFVSLKAASSLDGQLALQSGESKWISSEESRDIGHLLRAAHDAILVGAKTMEIDNPSLNIRSCHFPERKNKVVVFDPQGKILAKADQMKLAEVHCPLEVIFVVSDRLAEPVNPWGAQVLSSPLNSTGFDLNLVLTKLAGLGVHSLYVEGGAETLSSFILQKAAQRLYLFQAPMILGAKSGKSWSEQVTILNMSQRIEFKDQVFIPLSRDVFFSGRLM